MVALREQMQALKTRNTGPAPQAGAALATVLEDEPRLLLFTPSADGKVLENGRARAEVRQGNSRTATREPCIHVLVQACDSRCLMRWNDS